MLSAYSKFQITTKTVIIYLIKTKKVSLKILQIKMLKFT